MPRTLRCASSRASIRSRLLDAGALGRGLECGVVGARVEPIGEQRGGGDQGTVEQRHCEAVAGGRSWPPPRARPAVAAPISFQGVGLCASGRPSFNISSRLPRSIDRPAT